MPSNNPLKRLAHDKVHALNWRGSKAAQWGRWATLCFAL